MLKDGDVILFGTDSEVRVQVSASLWYTLNFMLGADAGCQCGYQASRTVGGTD